MIARFAFAVLDRLRALPTSTWVGTALGVVVSWVGVATLTKAPMTGPVALGFAWCMFVGVALSLLIGVLLTRYDRHEERLVHLEIRAERLPELPAVALPEADDEPEDVEPASYYERLRASRLVEAVNARMQPTFLEPEPPVTEPSPVVRPSPVPREVEPMPVTEPMELADEMAADAHAHVAREAVLTDEEWQAKQEAEWAAIKADIAKMAKGVAT